MIGLCGGSRNHVGLVDTVRRQPRGVGEPHAARFVGHCRDRIHSPTGPARLVEASISSTVPVR